MNTKNVIALSIVFSIALYSSIGKAAAAGADIQQYRALIKKSCQEHKRIMRDVRRNSKLVVAGMWDVRRNSIDRQRILHGGRGSIPTHSK